MNDCVYGNIKLEDVMGMSIASSVTRDMSMISKAKLDIHVV